MAEEMQTYGQTNESVVIYQSADNAVRLDVQLAEEMVWLSQKQMAQLFDTTPQNITLHIGNVYKEQELTQSATCKDFLQVQIEGGKEKRRLTKFYNLDVIISVGYRVKSKTKEYKWIFIPKSCRMRCYWHKTSLTANTETYLSIKRTACMIGL